MVLKMDRQGFLRVMKQISEQFEDKSRLRAVRSWLAHMHFKIERAYKWRQEDDEQEMHSLEEQVKQDAQARVALPLHTRSPQAAATVPPTAPNQSS